MNKIVLVFIIVILIVISLPFLFTLPAFIPQLDFSKTGNIGDTIGGITAPILSVIGSLLLYVSFMEQKKSNDDQIKALNDEKNRVSKTVSFERAMLHYNEIKKTLDNWEFIVRFYPTRDSSTTIHPPVRYKGINALNEFTNRLVYPKSSHGILEDLYSPLLNFQFILLSTHDLLVNTKQLITDEADKTFLNNRIHLFYSSFLRPFANIIIENGDIIRSEYSIKEIKELYDKIESILLTID